jgi:YegS/Rv2252/BmrU family lipid kinase
VHVVAIINPISGAGADTHAAAKRTALLQEQLDRRRLRADIRFTEYAGHARVLAAAAAQAGADLVIAWGGDGTANESGSALLGTRTALGLVPSGSGNGLAAALGCRRDPASAIAAALEGPVRAIDAGRLGDRPFFNIAGIGIDARIAALFNARAKGSRGRWPYIMIGVREGFRYRSRDYDLDLDGEARRVRALLIAFANGCEYGNGARLSTRAQIDDGFLDAFVAEDRRVAARFWDARHLATGETHRAPRVVVRPIRRAVVGCSEPMEFHVDGEPGIAEGRLEVSVLPRALLVKG